MLRLPTLRLERERATTSLVEAAETARKRGLRHVPVTRVRARPKPPNEVHERAQRDLAGFE